MAILVFTAGLDDILDQTVNYTCAVSVVNATGTRTGTIYNLCAIDQLNINTNDASQLALQQLSCPDIIDILSNSVSRVNNICANVQAHIQTS